jgi:hypothetical protein
MVNLGHGPAEPRRYLYQCMNHSHSQTATIAISCARFATLISVIVVCTVFAFDVIPNSPSKRDTTQVSAACFAVVGIIAMMPWQLAPLTEERNSAQYAKLVNSGIRMCTGSLLFLCATVLKYALLHYPNHGSGDPIEFALSFTAFISFLVGSVTAAFGFSHFYDYIACKTHCDRPSECEVGTREHTEEYLNDPVVHDVSMDK